MKTIYLFLILFGVGETCLAQVKEKYVLQGKLWSAIVNNNQSDIKNLLKQGIDINEKTYQETYLLLEAAKHSKAETVKLLIDNGADVNIKNHNNQTAMNYCLNNKSVIELKNSEYTGQEIVNEAEVIKIIKILVAAGANIDNVDNFGRTLLFDAVSEGYLNIAKNALELGANINFRHPKTGTTVLTWICRKSNVKTIEFLLENGADINAKDFDNSNPLYQAAISEQPENVEILIKNGADPFIKVGNSNALKNSINIELWEILKIILSHVDDINFNYEDRGYGLVHEAVINDNIELLKIMIELGANLNQKNKYGSTALSLAIYDKKTEIIELLEANGARK